MSARPPVIFLSDFGAADEFAGVCRAVIARLAPGAAVIDLTHGIAPADVRRGALALAAAAAYAPSPAVWLGVVDPGVGTERRAVAIRAGDGYLVGPDNGLLSLVIEALGGADQAVEISRTPVRLEPTSNTFHGRDVFAPVAATLARGGPLDELGEPLDPASLSTLELPRAKAEPGRLTAHVLYADVYGNLVLDAIADDLAGAGLGGIAAVSISTKLGSHPARRGATFSDARGGPGPGPALVLYDDSVGRIGLAVDRGSAAAALGLARDEELTIEAAG